MWKIIKNQTKIDNLHKWLYNIIIVGYITFLYNPLIYIPNACKNFSRDTAKAQIFHVLKLSIYKLWTKLGGEIIMKKTSKTNSWKSITVVLFVLVVSAVIATFVGCSNTKESPNEVAKPEIHVKFYDVVAYYGDGPVPVNFDFEIITKGYDISKDDLSKKVGINREPGLEVGKYAIIGENKDPNLDIKFQEATYEIRKASYDISDIKFPDKNVVGNGKVQRLQINGKIPDGVTV